MHYCKYHPSLLATHHCEICDIYNCDSCVDDTKGIGLFAKCFHCRHSLTSLGASQTAVPFWRRLKESFRYPVNSDSIMLIIGCSILLSILSYMPFAILWLLAVTGAMMKYSFACLQDSAEGNLNAPSISEAYQGGIVLILQLLFLCFCIGAAMVKAYAYFGPGIGMLVSTILIAALPAMIINFSMNDSIWAALSPIKNVQLVAAVGPSYGLLLAFIMIMFASVGLINEVLASFSSFLSTIIQTAVFNFYLIVVFHIMGYMIFQYQANIGYSAREDDAQGAGTRSERDRKRAEIDIHLKEGNYTRVLEQFIALIRRYPSDINLHADFFNFLSATKDAHNLEKLANAYFSLLCDSEMKEQLYTEYRRSTVLCPDYIPDTAKARHLIAEKTLASGDFKNTIRLINGIHKVHPNYKKLAEAYDLMAEALRHTPKLVAQVEVCEKLANKYRKPKPRVGPEADKERRNTKALEGSDALAKNVALSAEAKGETKPKEIKPVGKAQFAVGQALQSETADEALARVKAPKGSSTSLAENGPASKNELPPIEFDL